MIPTNIRRDDLLKAISEIDRNGIRKGRHSSTYDLVYDNKKYPPKLVLSIANRFVNGEELDPKDFSGGKGTQAFELLIREGFTINDKVKSGEVFYSTQLRQFLEQARTENLKTKHFDKSLETLKVKVSFGQGGKAKIPWISFLKEPFTTSDGIYPVYLYYTELERLILAYGVSETTIPAAQWKLSNPKTISEYFDEEGYGKPARYGKSFVFKDYDVNDLANDKTLNEDLMAILNEYESVNVDKTQNNNIKVNQKPNFVMKELLNDFEKAGLRFRDSMVIRFVSSLVTKPFVLLSGLSGSGKTKIALSFAQWVCETKSQYSIVPIGADWTNREPLLGYVNALAENKFVVPENGALRLIIEANKKENESKPFFLILDEMNLSHVERYFADFLSVMESKDSFKLHSSATALDGNGIDVEKEYGWPKNLFVIGTVNIDETTYMFSPKVLDRANLIEFRVDEGDMINYLNRPSTINDLSGEGSNMGMAFVQIARQNEESNSKEISSALKKFFNRLQPIGAEFGYRTASEIQTLFAKIDIVTTDYIGKPNDKIDFAIMQKLLPKLHGSRNKLDKVLKRLACLCYGEELEIDEKIEKNIFKNSEDYKANIIYPISLEKITRMHKNVMENGFTSYAEA